MSQSLSSLQTVEHLLRRSLNIGFEWSILVEAQQVIDELQVMQEIFTQQASVMRELERHLKAMPRSARAKHGGQVPVIDIDNEASKKFKQQRVLEGVSSLLSDMEQRRDELASMEKLQTKTRAQVRAQQQRDCGGMLTMVATRAPGHEAAAVECYRGKGRYPASRRECSSGTVHCRLHRCHHFLRAYRLRRLNYELTIAQLPLSFMTSVFGMNATEISNDGKMSLHDMLVYMCMSPRFLV